MALNLRSVTPELHKKLKLAACQSGVALERFCIDLLARGVNSSVERTAHNGMAAGSTPAPRTTSHDPSTCRIYRCGLCLAMEGQS